MQTDDYCEKITIPSDSVQVTVRDFNGRIRVFYLDNAQVILRYVTGKNSSAYHPSNLQDTNKFNVESCNDVRLELVITTSHEISLEVEI